MITAKELRSITQSLNILYAEDEAMLREDLQTTLSKLFANTFTATNGQEAIEIFKKEKIDLILTDINMPIMNGIELINEVKKLQQDELQIIVLSAHNEVRLLTNLINIGVDGFLNKPLNKEKMIDILYKSAKILDDRKMLLAFQKQQEEEFLIIQRKNEVLEQKYNQFAAQINKSSQPSIQKQEKMPLKEDGYFQTLLQDDKDELTDLAFEIDNYIAMLFKTDSMDANYLNKVSNAYKKYGAVLNTYPEFYDIGNRLGDFAHEILKLEHKFMEDLHQTGIFFESLQLSLESFRENIWNKEAKQPRFYNASLIVDIQGVIDFLHNKEQEDSEMEFF